MFFNTIQKRIEIFKWGENLQTRKKSLNASKVVNALSDLIDRPYWMKRFPAERLKIRSRVWSSSAEISFNDMWHEEAVQVLILKAHNTHQSTTALGFK